MTHARHTQRFVDVVWGQLWKGMADEGLITQDEYRQTAFAQYYRTKEEFLAPLTDPISPVASLRLKVDACMTDIVRCPYRQSFGNGSSWCAACAVCAVCGVRCAVCGACRAF